MKNKLEMWEIFVPAQMNNKKIPIAFHKKWDAKVCLITGGLTIYKPSIGLWTDVSNEVIKDKMIPVRILCTKKQLHTIMEITSKHYYKEQTILAYQVSNKFVFLNKN